MAIIFLCMMISINFLYAEKCYICDQTGCDRPGATDIKDCSDAELGGTSGKAFVNGAFGKNETDIYTVIQNEYNAFLLTIQVNQTFASWTSLTKWVNFFKILITTCDLFRYVIRPKINVVVVYL